MHLQYCLTAEPIITGEGCLAGVGGVSRCSSPDSTNPGELTCQHPKKDSAAGNVRIVDAGGPKNGVD